MWTYRLQINGAFGHTFMTGTALAAAIMEVSRLQRNGSRSLQHLTLRSDYFPDYPTEMKLVFDYLTIGWNVKIEEMGKYDAASLLS